MIAESNEAQLYVAAKRVPIPTTTAASPAAGPSLPVTGSSTTLLVLAGLAAVAVGAGLVFLARRRWIHLQVRSTVTLGPGGP